MRLGQTLISTGGRAVRAPATSLLLLLNSSLHSAQTEAWFRSEPGRRAVDNVLTWQAPTGAWPKNQDLLAKPFEGEPSSLQGTFDNGATTTELRLLAKAFATTKEPRYQAALLKGLQHVLQAQYPSGGWPQFHPPPAQSYHRYITFNDGTMVRLMELMRDVSESAEFQSVPAEMRRRAARAFERGLDCILKCQVMVEDKPTVWCAQHDPTDFRPRPGRTYELVSLSGAESAGVLRLLMSIPRPSAELQRAIRAGADWFAAAKISGIKQVVVNGNKLIVPDASAPSLWARFYEIGSNRPFFAGRDGVKRYELAEIEAERRNGYAWYGNWGEAVAREFTRWPETQRR